jgi:predicted transcriptional regulator of viral defense system
MRWIELQKRIAEKGIAIFTVSEFRRMMDLSETAAQKILERYAKRGLLTRLKNGMYIVTDNPPTSFLISNRLYRPSYVSFESALSYHNIIPETVYGVTAATTKPTRDFEVEGKAFIYHKIKLSAYTGYVPTKIGDEVILLASPEKAVVDYLYLVNLGKKPLYERLDIEALSPEKIVANTILFKRPSFYKWVQNDILRND